MDHDRAERVALTEAAFRIANDRMSGWPERRHAQDVAAYYCECAIEGCREVIRLSTTQYEEVRAHPRHFVVLHGHILPEFETELEEHDEYSVIEKPGAVSSLLQDTDPRGEPGGPAHDEATRMADDIRRDDS